MRLGFAPDMRDFTPAAHILKALDVKAVRLLTNNPLKSSALEELGIDVTERIPLVIPPNPYNASYLASKHERMGHFHTETTET